MYSDYKKVCKVFKENCILSDFTTFKIGGIGKIVFFPKTAEEFKDLLVLCHKKGETPFILGNGSNLLVSDQGYQGVIICTRRLDDIKFENNIVLANAGAKLPALCFEAQKRSLSGLEFACGIPATLGGAIKMNAGAYGNAIGNVVEYVTVFRRGEVCIEKPTFGYRKSSIDDESIIIGASLRLERLDRDLIKRQIFLNGKARKFSQPTGYSAGSVFLSVGGVSAGYYVDKAGLKGLQIGGAKVSEKHANFIINTGKSTSSDVCALIQKIKEEVYGKFGINLCTEIRFLGEFNETLR